MNRKKCIADDLVEEAKQAQERVAIAMRRLARVLDRNDLKLKVTPKPDPPKRYINGAAD